MMRLEIMLEKLYTVRWDPWPETPNCRPEAERPHGFSWRPCERYRRWR